MKQSKLPDQSQLAHSFPGQMRETSSTFGKRTPDDPTEGGDSRIDDGTVSGIIDWESAAYYPRFWVATRPRLGPLTWNARLRTQSSGGSFSDRHSKHGGSSDYTQSSTVGLQLWRRRWNLGSMVRRAFTLRVARTQTYRRGIRRYCPGPEAEKTLGSTGQGRKIRVQTTWIITVSALG